MLHLLGIQQRKVGFHTFDKELAESVLDHPHSSMRELSSMSDRQPQVAASTGIRISAAGEPAGWRQFALHAIAEIL